MVDQPPKTKPSTTIGTEDQAQPPPTDLDKDQAKDGTRLDLWTALQSKKLVKSTELTEAEKKLLAGLTVADRANGWQSIYVDGQTDAQIHVSPTKSVYINTNAPIGSDKQIDAILKGAVVAKSVRGSEAIPIVAGDEKTLAIMAKCSELAGVHVSNPPAQLLDQTDPALAKAVEARWRLMNGQPPLATEKLDHTSTAGLVTTSSPLDTAPPAGQHFAAAVTPPAAAAATVAPAPVVAPKQAPT